MELSPAIESSITSDCSGGNDRSIVDEAFNGKISAFDQYHSSEHGAHSHIESIDTARSSGFEANKIIFVKTGTASLLIATRP